VDDSRRPAQSAGAEQMDSVDCVSERLAEELSVTPRTSRSDVGRGLQAARRKLSRLALAAGVLGILALLLFFLTPVIYFIAAIIGDAVDEEIVAIGFLGAHTLALAVGGGLAVAFGIAALVQLRRRSRNLVGYGWAITGLCTGPVPMLVGGLVVLVAGLQMVPSLIGMTQEAVQVADVTVAKKSHTYESDKLSRTESDSQGQPSFPNLGPKQVAPYGYDAVSPVAPAAVSPYGYDAVPTALAAPSAAAPQDFIPPTTAIEPPPR
jgi:hypothetical protein